MADPVTLDLSQAQPIQQPPVQLDMSKAEPLDKQGFLKSLAGDLLGIAKSLPQMNPASVAYHDVKQGIENLKSVLAGGQTQQEEAAQQREKAGYGKAYSRVVAPAAENLGVNVPGMEQAAAQGDTGGVMGHAAAVPVALAATEGVARGAPPAFRGARSVVDSATPYVAPIAKGAARTIDAATFERAGKIYNAWKQVPAEIRARIEANTPVYPGAPLPANPGVFPGAPLPETPAPALLQGNALLRGPVANAAPPPASALSEIPVAPEYPGAPLPARPPWIHGEPAPSSAPPATMTQVATDAVKAAGGNPEVPFKPQVGKPIYQKPAAGSSPVPRPNEMPPLTKADSTAIEGYHYDPNAQVMTVKTRGGAAYRYGEVTPEEANAFAQADSKGKAYQKLRDDHVMTAANYGTGWLVKRAKGSAGPTDLEQQLEESIRQAKGKKD